MEAPVKVFVVHNRPLLFEGIRAVLDSAGGFTIVGSAQDVGEALKLGANFALDVFLIDLHEGVASFPDALKRLASTFPTIPVVVLSSGCSPRCIRRATSLGAKGFVCELSPPSQLPRALKAAASGNYFFDHETAKELLGMVAAMPEESFLYPDEGYQTLTEREREVFHMLADGLSNKEIAFHLGISRKTVETHHHRISQKLGTHESVELLRYAARLGILDL